MPKSSRDDSDRRPPQVLQGTVDMLILKALSRGRAHGYAIAEWIHTTSAEALLVEEGALYPALHRLELRGMLDAEWGLSETNRRVKSYKLTADGRRQLAAEREQWTRLSAGIVRILESR